MNRSTWITTGFAALAVASISLFATVYAGESHDKDAKQAKAEVGKPAPQFKAYDADGNKIKLSDLTKDGKIVVLEWFNPDCPFVKKHYEKSQTMNDLAAKYADKDVVWLAVNSSSYADAEFDKTWAKKWGVNHPIIVDQDGRIGRMYGAKTTPDMFIINTDGILVYAGAIDDNDSTTPNDDTTNYVDNALIQLISGKPITTPQTRSYGCSVKYSQQAADADSSSDNKS
jgi:peroxiredoxin